MKYMPSRFSFFDDLMDFRPFTQAENKLMKTDVYEKDGKYLLNVELPGINKEDINISLNNGNLVVSASRNTSNEEKDEKGNVIRLERYQGSYSRSFYVGNKVSEEDIDAKYENGELKIEIKNLKEIENQTKKIEIK